MRAHHDRKGVVGRRKHLIPQFMGWHASEYVCVQACICVCLCVSVCVCAYCFYIRFCIKAIQNQQIFGLHVCSTHEKGTFEMLWSYRNSWQHVDYGASREARKAVACTALAW